MAEVTINYKDAAIATMDASGTKTLQTQGKYCEDDIEVVYARPSAPSGTKQISITQNGTTVEDVAAYANAEITVNVSGGGGDYEIVGGTVTLASEAASVSVETGFDPEYAYISTSIYSPEPTLLPTSWRTCSMVLDRVNKCGVFMNIRNLNGNHNTAGGALNNSRLGSYSNGYYTFERSNNTANYLSGIVYYWFAWRAKT